MLQRVVSFQGLALALLTALPAMAGVQACPVQTPCIYAGEAEVASANVLGINAALSSTGQLPSTGGSLSTQLANANLPGVLNVQLLSASTSGASGRTSSQASVTNVSLSAAGISVTASVLTSNATAQACGAGVPAVTGGSNIVGLNVNGQPITVTGAPNQTVSLLIGSLIINEQISTVTNSSAGGTADIVVNALHLKVLGVADVVISSSHAGVCGGAGCKP